MDFEELIEYGNTNNEYGKRLGIHIEKIIVESAVVSKMVTQEDSNPLAGIHGGICFSTADTV